jgi:DNA-binding MurR/RpiR family transcriptional regulator
VPTANPVDTMTMPSDLDNLRERLRRDYDDFSPAQQALARYVADHLPDLPLMSAHEVARAAHCSPATVVRFAQALGFNGYPDLQQVVRRDQRPWLPTPVREHRFGVIGGADSVASALAAERHALEDTADRLGQRGLGPVAQALAGRRPVVVAGDGHARVVVGLLVDRLARIGVPAVGISGLDLQDRAWFDSLAPTGAVLAISVGREAQVAEAAIDAAVIAKVPATALVDSTLSPLARLPLARVVPADNRSGVPSLVAMVAVAQALVVLVEAAVRRGSGRVADGDDRELSAIGA